MLPFFDRKKFGQEEQGLWARASFQSIKLRFQMGHGAPPAFTLCSLGRLRNLKKLPRQVRGSLRNVSQLEFFLNGTVSRLAAVFLAVGAACMFVMFLCVRRVSMRHVSVMSGLFVMACFMMFGCFRMMTGSVLMMFGGLLVMVCGRLGHFDLPLQGSGVAP